MLAAIAVLAMLGSAPAHAVTLVTPDGQPVAGPWQGWVNRYQALTISGPLLFESTEQLGCGPGAISCAVGPPWYGSTYGIAVAPGPFARRALAEELGHQFDWRYLTAADRRMFARAWAHPKTPWLDSDEALAVGVEDGLEGVFIQVYAECALGEDPSDHPAVLAKVISPTLISDADAVFAPSSSCVTIRWIARRNR